MYILYIRYKSVRCGILGRLVITVVFRVFKSAHVIYGVQHFGARFESILFFVIECMPHNRGAAFWGNW